MTPSLARVSARSSPPPRGPAPARSGAPEAHAQAADGRLALLDHLLASLDEREICELALDWLSRTVPLRRAMILVVDPDRDHLVGRAGYGLPAGSVERASVDLSNRKSFLALALEGHEPVSIDARIARTAAADAPLGRVSFQAVPLGTAEASGLLLISGFPGGVPDPVRWVARVVGVRLRALRALRLEHENGRLPVSYTHLTLPTILRV